MERKKQIHARITGRVQGVFFRAETKRAAEKFGITGWVRNRPDGSVEAVFEGDETPLKQMIQWCHEGPPASRVDQVEMETITSDSQFSSFKIIY